MLLAIAGFLIQSTVAIILSICLKTWQLAPPPVQDGDLATIAVPIDFLGVNNYSRSLVTGSQALVPADSCTTVSPVPGACYTEMAWEVYPQALQDLLLRLYQEYHVPASM